MSRGTDLAAGGEPTDRSSRAVAGLAIALVVLGCGVALLASTSRGLVAHFFAPASKQPDAPLEEPHGPADTVELRPGLHVTVETSGRSRKRIIWPDAQEIYWFHEPPVAARWRGYLKVDEPGVHRFELTATHDIAVRLNGEKVGGVHAPELVMDEIYQDRFAVPLAAGLHTIAIDQSGTEPEPTVRVTLEWAPPGGKMGTIPADRLWSDAEPAAWEARALDARLAPTAPESAELAGRHLGGVRMHDLTFVTGDRLYHPVVRLWDYERLGFPHHFPGHRVLWRGRIRARDAGTWVLAAKTPGEVHLAVGGVEATTGGSDHETAAARVALTRGWHDVAISLRSPWPETPLLITWNREGEPSRPPRAGDLRPLARDARWSRGPRAAGWLAIFGSLAVASASLMLLIRERSLGPRVLAAGLQRHALAIGLVLVGTAGLALRLADYDSVPHHKLSHDEYANAWAGWHLARGQAPRAWVFRPDLYENVETVEWFDSKLSLASPYLDRPPLFPLLLGVFDRIVARSQSFWALSMHTFRWVPILLSLAALPLVASLAVRLYGSRLAGFLAAMLLALAPICVLNHRGAKGQILLVLLILAGMWCGFRHLDTGRARWLWLAGACAGLAPWTKEVGIVALVLIPWLWLREQRWRDGFKVVAIGVAFIAAYLAYGSLLDFEGFWRVSTEHGAMPSSYHVAWDLLTSVRMAVLELPGGSGWILWLWMAVVYSCSREDRLPAVAAVTLLVLQAGVANARWWFGWYYIPMLPFLSIGGGLFLADFLRRPDVARGALFLFTTIFMMLDATVGGELIEPATTRLTIAAALAPLALATFLPGRVVRRFAQGWAVVLIVAALALGARMVLAAG